MRRACIVAMVFIYVGCGPRSDVSSTATINVGGSAQQANGSAYANTTINLYRYPDALESLIDAAEIVSSLGITCLFNQSAQSNSLCGAFRQATTASDGTYEFVSMVGSDTQGSVGEALNFSTTVAGPLAGAFVQPSAVSVEFYVQTGNLTVPPMELWASAANVSTSSGNTTFTWATPPSIAYDDTVVVTTQTSLTTDGAVVWEQYDPNVRTHSVIDSRVTQDFSGSFYVITTGTTPGTGNDNTDFYYTYTGPSVAYPSTSHVPVSRNAACFVESHAGTATPLTPCPVTDANFKTSLVANANACVGNPTNPNLCVSNPNWFYVDLGSAQALTLAVLYDVGVTSFDPNNTTPTLYLDGATDPNAVAAGNPNAWSTITQTGTTPYKALDMNGTYRFVRLRAAPQGAFFQAGNSEFALY